MKRIYVKFYGFSDTERHALDSVFRLSESRDIVYSAWTAQTAEARHAPDILLIDGDSWEAVLELANPLHDAVKLIWIGEDPPVQAWRTFPAPVKWSAVLEAMDEEFAPPAPSSPSPLSDLSPLPSAAAPASSALDLDLAHEHDLDVMLDAGADDTEPLPLEPGALPAGGRRVLVVDTGRDDRLYLRAKLAAAGLHEVDEAATGTEALVLLNTHAYQLVTLDLGLTDIDPWQLIKAVDNTRPAIAHLFVTGAAPNWQQGLRARFSGAQVYLKKPLHPGQLKKLLQKL
ncbi:response regulator [Polaromonas sp.]|uniref:response regulator n=1 Tax=Polaromonas sp. TaxID=1869339 RepID=UPI003266989E